MQKLLSVKLLSVFMVIGLLCGFMPAALAETTLANKQYKMVEPVTTIDVQEKDAAVVIQTAKTESILIEYVEPFDEELYDFSFEDGVLAIKKLKTIREAMGDAVPTGDYVLVITVPEREYKNITVKNISNGSATFKNLNAQEFSISIKNGNVVLDHTSSQDVSAAVSNGRIIFQYSDSGTYDCRVSNGQVWGYISGKKTDYSIEASIKHGRSNLCSQVIEGSSRSLGITVINGTISVQFTE